METKNRLVLTLPEELADMQVIVVRSSADRKIIFNIRKTEEDTLEQSGCQRMKYAFVWRQEDYLKVPLTEIMWIEAERSYSIVKMTGDRSITISYNLSVIEKNLLNTDLMRIHRSYIVNLNFVNSLSGNCLVVGTKPFPIGREYRSRILERFIFLGVRRRKIK